MPPEPQPFYTDEQTQRSQRVLGKVLEAAPDAVLIGGWGTWVRKGGHKSHDIDVICDHASAARIEAASTDYGASDHLGGTKYRATVDGIHVDVYVPYQSRLGQRLRLRVEDLAHHHEHVSGHRVLTAPAHVSTKLAALLDRPDSHPGQKDRYEIGRFLDEVDPHDVIGVIAGASELDSADIPGLVDEAFGYLLEGQGKKDRKRTADHRKKWNAAAAELALAQAAHDKVRRHNAAPQPPGAQPCGSRNTDDGQPCQKRGCTIPRHQR